MTYFSEIFSNLLDIKIATEYLHFDALEEIFDSSLNISASPTLFNRDFDPDDRFIQKLQSKLMNFSDEFECMLELRKTYNHICFVPQHLVGTWMQSVTQYDYKPVLMIANFEISFDLTLRYIY